MLRAIEAIDPAVQDFLNSTSVMSKSTAETYRYRLYPFQKWVHKQHKKSVDALIAEIRAAKLDVYSMLGSYATHLQKMVGESGKGLASLKRRVNVVKLLLVYHDVEISDLKFKTKVKLPRTVRAEKSPISVNDVRAILQALNNDKKAHLYILLLAGTGMRAKEALALRFADFQIESSDPNNKDFIPRVNIRGEITKTRVGRYVYLTKEFVKFFNDYKVWRHRERRIVHYDENEKVKERKFKPPYRATDLIFSKPHEDPRDNAKVNSLYVEMLRSVNATIDRIGKGQIDYQNVRKITRHSFRRFVYTTISRLGDTQYAEWFIGHIGSTYDRRNEEERIEAFQNVERYLTFLDVAALEAKGAATDSKIEVLQKENLDMKTNMAAMIQAEVEKAVARAMELRAQNPVLENFKLEAQLKKKVES